MSALTPLPPICSDPSEQEHRSESSCNSTCPEVSLSRLPDHGTDLRARRRTHKRRFGQHASWKALSASVRSMLKAVKGPVEDLYVTNAAWSTAMTGPPRRRGRARDGGERVLRSWRAGAAACGAGRPATLTVQPSARRQPRSGRPRRAEQPVSDARCAARGIASFVKAVGYGQSAPSPRSAPLAAGPAIEARAPPWIPASAHLSQCQSPDTAPTAPRTLRLMLPARMRLGLPPERQLND